MSSEFDLIRQYFTRQTRQTALGVGDDAFAGQTGELLGAEIAFKLVERVGLTAHQRFADLGEVAHMQVDDEAERRRRIAFHAHGAPAALNNAPRSTAVPTIASKSRIR